ncbi:LDH2 family malate/lactate/ureidoglycolate dehydrogenase [Bradyrhizobium sp. F1.4.3]|uniref:Ldh family oxidoreductase n=1 Tax=Bradyrhizobium sp. F1.4.3 TaxID=3156356 RepID=UPI003395D4F4
MADRCRDTSAIDRRNGGVLLPFAGTEGYKDSRLTAIAGILCGLLTGLEFKVEPIGRENFGCLVAVFNRSAFYSLCKFKENVAEFARYLKAADPRTAHPGVFYPGETGWCPKRSVRQRALKSR